MSSDVAAQLQRPEPNRDLHEFREREPALGDPPRDEQRALFLSEHHRRPTARRAAWLATFPAVVTGSAVREPGSLAAITAYAVYVNYLVADDDDRLAEAFGTNRRRLEQIRRAVDPDGAFSSRESPATFG